MPRVDQVGTRKKVRRAPSKRPETAGNPTIAKKPKVVARPAPKTQPGPFRGSERKVVRKNTKTPAYQKALRVAQKYGTHDYHGRSDVYTDAQRKKAKPVSDAAIKRARVQVLRERRVTGLKLIAQGLDHLGHKASAIYEHSHSGAHGGGIATALAPDAHGVTALKLGKATVEDAFNFPAQAVASTYDLGAGAVEAAQGNTKRLKQTVKGFKETDPVYNTAAAGVEALKGNSRAAEEHLQKAKKSAIAHPGFTALEVAGVKGGAGRGAGRVMRSGIVGEKAKLAASTQRASRQVEGTRITEPRSYSKDVITKSRQVAVEKSRRKTARNLEHRAASEPSRDRAEATRRRSARFNPDRVPDREIKRQVDEHIAAHEQIRRIHRTKITNEAHKIVKKGNHATTVVAQGIVRADPKDIKAYISELEQEYPNLDRAGRRANKELRDGLASALKSGNFKEIEQQAQAYRKLTAPLQKKLVKKGLLSKEQESTAKLIPYAVRNMGARFDEEAGRLVKDRKVIRVKDGKRTVTSEATPLGPEAIRAHMRHRDIPEPSFVTQAANKRGAQNFNVRGERAVTITGPRRTGAATIKGTLDAHPDVLPEQAARSQGLLDAVDMFTKGINRFAHRKSSGKVRSFKTRKDAEKFIRNHVLNESGRKNANAPLKAVRTNPFGATNEQLHSLLEEANTPDAHNHVYDSMVKALDGEEGSGPWAVIPEVAAKRIQDQLNTQGGSGGIKSLQVISQTFRKTVLATSPKWLAGNIFEGLLRSGVAHAGPRSWLTGHKVMRELENISPKQAEQAAVRMIGGGHFSMVDRTNIRRGAEQFKGTELAPLATGLGKFWRTPGPKQVAQVWNAWTNLVFHSVNGKLESQIQTAMLGKVVRDSQLMDGRLLKLSNAAITDAAKGLTETDNQIAFGRAIDDMYGRYSKFGPAKRKAIATYTPFVAWFLNALKFTYVVLPRDHPVLTGLIAAEENATEEWRKSKDLDLFMTNALPGFLQGTIPTKGGGHLDVARFTPFGFGGDPLGTAAGQVNPLFSGVLAAFEGKDWKGDDLPKKDPVSRLTAAAIAFAGSTVPAMSVTQRVIAKGPSTLNPLRPYAPSKTTTIRKAPSGFDFGGSSGNFDFNQGSGGFDFSGG